VNAALTHWVARHSRARPGSPPAWRTSAGSLARSSCRGLRCRFPPKDRGGFGLCGWFGALSTP